MKRYFFLGTMLILITCMATAQSPERPKKTVPMISGVVSRLDKATGWTLQNNGEWTSDQNEIPFRDYKLNRIHRGKYALGKENFEEINVRQVVIGQTVYSIHIVKYRDGRYQFPVLEQNWNKFDALKYYVFNEQRWNQVWPDSIVFNRPYAVNMDLLCSGTIEEYNDKTYLYEIENSIRKAVYLKEKSLINLIFAGYPVEVDGKKYMRFKFYESINKKEIYVKYLLTYNWDKLFKNSYYEVKFDVFDRFIRNIGVTDPRKENIPGYYMDFAQSGKTAFRKGQYNTALVDFTKASLLNAPDSAQAPLMLWKARAMVELKQYDEALEQLNKLLYLETTAQNTSGHLPEIYYLKASAESGASQTAQACADWQKALEMGYAGAKAMIKKHCEKRQGEDGKTINPEKSDKLFEKGYKDYTRGKYLEALLAFEDAQHSNPSGTDFRIPYYIGMSRFNLGDYVRAVDDFDAAITMAKEAGTTGDDLYSNAFLMRGRAWQKSGDPQQACTDWMTADSLGNANAMSYLEANCILPDKEPETETVPANAMFDRGIELYKQGSYTEAIAAFDSVMNSNPQFDNILLFTYRGSAKHKTGNYQGAIEDFTRAIEMKPAEQQHYLEWVRAWFNRGVSKYLLHDEAGACADWQKALDLGLEDSEARSYVTRYCRH